MFLQIQKYVLQLKENPCADRSQSRDSLVQQRCRSTDWVVLASLLTLLFGLQDKVSTVFALFRMKNTNQDQR